jgi:cell division protein ZapA
MSESRSLQVSIMGRDYRVACAEQEEAGLLEAVDYLNGKMQDLRDRSKVVGTERLAVMAALNIAHEFLSMKVGGNFDIAETKRRIKRMETTIDQAMAEQSKLF